MTTKLWSLLTWLPCSMPSLLTKHAIISRKKLEDDSFFHSRKKLDIKDICSLRHVVVSNKYFMFNDMIYKKIPAAPWVVPLALLLLSCVWKRRSKNQQFLPQLLLQHSGNATLTIAFAFLRKMKSQSSTTYLTVLILASPLLLNMRVMDKSYFLIL